MIFTRILLAVAMAWALATASMALERASRADRVAAAVVRAVELARAGNEADATALLDRVLKAAPDVTRARYLRAKLRFRARQFEDAEADAAQVLREAPSMKGAAELAARIREHVTPRTVTVVGGAAEYSEWQWSWTIDGAKPFRLAGYLGGQGHTLFYWPARPDEHGDWERYESESSGDRMYFLRVVRVRGADGAANLELPGAKMHDVPAAPYMLLVTSEGAVAAKGTPAEVEPKLEEIRKAHRKKPASIAETLVTEDVSASSPALADFAADGYTTIVMMTSLACPPCRALKPSVREIPSKHSDVRVVLAEIGVTPEGGINWGSPFFQASGQQGVPYFYVLDGQGQVVKSGGAEAIAEWRQP